MEASVASLQAKASSGASDQGANPATLRALPGRVSNVSQQVTNDESVGLYWLLALTVAFILGFLAIIMWLRPRSREPSEA